MLSDPITGYRADSPSTGGDRLGYILSPSINLDVIKIWLVTRNRQFIIIRLVLLLSYRHRDIYRFLYRVTVQRDINRERLRYCLYQCLIDRVRDAVMYRIHLAERVGLGYRITGYISTDMVASRETGYQAH